MPQAGGQGGQNHPWLRATAVDSCTPHQACFPSHLTLTPSVVHTGLGSAAFPGQPRAHLSGTVGQPIPAPPSLKVPSKGCQGWLSAMPSGSPRALGRGPPLPHLSSQFFFVHPEKPRSGRSSPPPPPATSVICSPSLSLLSWPRTLSSACFCPVPVCLGLVSQWLRILLPCWVSSQEGSPKCSLCWLCCYLQLGAGREGRL